MTQFVKTTKQIKSLLSKPNASYIIAVAKLFVRRNTNRVHSNINLTFDYLSRNRFLSKP